MVTCLAAFLADGRPPGTNELWALLMLVRAARGLLLVGAARAWAAAPERLPAPPPGAAPGATHGRPLPAAPPRAAFHAACP